jgi:hypothetical protein
VLDQPKLDSNSTAARICLGVAIFGAAMFVAVLVAGALLR